MMPLQDYVDVSPVAGFQMRTVSSLEQEASMRIVKRVSHRPDRAAMPFQYA